MVVKIKNILGSKSDDEKPAEYKKRGMGTRTAEYSEAGPFSCAYCWYLVSLEPKEEATGLCSESHMLADSDTHKTEENGKLFAVVNKFYGCCRYVDPVDKGEPTKKFVFQGNPQEESEEHSERRLE